MVLLPVGSVLSRLINRDPRLHIKFYYEKKSNRLITDTIKIKETERKEVNESRLLIKAATYHNLSLKRTDSYWEAVVIFDI